MTHLEPQQNICLTVQWSVTHLWWKATQHRHWLDWVWMGLQYFHAFKSSKNSIWPQDLLKICPAKFDVNFVQQLVVTNTGFFQYRRGIMGSCHRPKGSSCDQTLLQFELRLTFFGSRLPSQGSLKKFRKRGSFGCKTVYIRYWGPDFLVLKLLRMQPSFKLDLMIFNSSWLC